jgi:FMN phosphatase YigB (HAD superfamily)
MPPDLRASIARAEAISFDVFDTLFIRPLDEPENVFDMLGEKFGIHDFRRLRQDAQAQAFRRMQEEGQNEITLNGIYGCLDVLPVSCDALRRAEYELELALTLPNPELVALFKDVAGRKPVVITSDMYLPESFFKELFRRHGLPDVPMFISSDQNATKRDRGELFDIVSNTLGIPHPGILHIGDNPFSDIQQAKAKGLSTFHYEGASQRRLVPPASPSAALARGMARIHDVPLPRNSLYDLGFLYGGPAAIGFLHWIEQQALQDGIDLILFVSRDGYVLERIARRGDVKLPVPFAYFEGTRVSFTLAATDETNYAEQIEFLIAGSQDLAPTEVLERIGVPLPADHVMADLGLSRDVVLNVETTSRLRAFLFAYRWEVLKVCRRNRRGLFQYLLAHGIAPGMKIAMVDIGWNGTTVEAFHDALGKLFDVELTGYYLCLTDHPDCLRRRQKVPLKALISTASVPIDTIERVYANRVAVELFFSAPHYPVIGYERTSDGQVRIIEDAGRSRINDWPGTSAELIRGIEDFSERFSLTCRAADYRPNPLDTVSPLTDFVTSINEKTVKVFSSMSNFDAWASSRNRNMEFADYVSIAPSRERT